MSEVEKELVKATNFEAEKDYKNRQDYLAVLARAVNNLDKDNYELLSNEAVNWFNEAAKAIRAHKDISDFSTSFTTEEVKEIEGETEEGVLPEDEHEDERVEPSITKEKKEKKPRKSKAKVSGEIDKWGIHIESNSSQVAAIFEQGSTMAFVRGQYGQNFYNLLKRLEKEGHKIERSQDQIKLIYVPKS